jgi:DNA invertase Pin-like site-specific DNA recombinase
MPVIDFSKLLERSRLEGWKLISLDIGLDTSTSVDEVCANLLMSFAQFERRMISQRTTDGPKIARARLAERGRKLGRPVGARDKKPRQRQAA